MQLDLKGKRALVLSSSRGLGLGIAEALAEEGAHVLLCGRNAARLAAAAGTIAARGGRADYVGADLADPGFAATVAAAAEDRLGGVDILVNNTGGPPPGTAAEMSPEALAAQFSMMVGAVVETTGRVLPQMRARRWGRILTLASSGAVQPIPNLAMSNALRPALIGWSKTLASEVAADGVTVNVLLPGRIATDRIEELDAANAKRQGKPVEEIRARSRAAIPMGRYGEVHEFAAVAAFLCSGAASYVTGTVMRCDGGLIASV